MLTNTFDEVKPTPILNKKLLLLKDLMTSRTKLISQKNSIQTYLNELRQISDKQVQKMMQQAHKTAIAGLEKSIKSIEAEMTKIIKEDAAVLANYNLLKTVPGVGHYCNLSDLLHQ
jgi:succinate dehydrogenase/fumarate reductase-like Fe-S protein